MGIFAIIKMSEFQRFGKAWQPTYWSPSVHSAIRTLILFWCLIKVTLAICKSCVCRKSARIFIPDRYSSSGLLLLVCLFFFSAWRILSETTGGGAAKPRGHWLHIHSSERHSWRDTASFQPLWPLSSARSQCQKVARWDTNLQHFINISLISLQSGQDLFLLPGTKPKHYGFHYFSQSSFIADTGGSLIPDSSSVLGWVGCKM